MINDVSDSKKSQLGRLCASCCQSSNSTCMSYTHKNNIFLYIYYNLNNCINIGPAGPASHLSNLMLLNKFSLKKKKTLKESSAKGTKWWCFFFTKLCLIAHPTRLYDTLPTTTYKAAPPAAKGHNLFTSDDAIIDEVLKRFEKLLKKENL